MDAMPGGGKGHTANRPSAIAAGEIRDYGEDLPA